MSDRATMLPPQPQPDFDTEGFWKATASGRVELCRCVECGLWHHPPLERCRACAGKTTFAPIAGTGRLRSFIVVQHGAVPGYLDAIPYVVGLVELDDQPGLRLVGRVLDVPSGEPTCGARVRCEVISLPPGEFSVVGFRIEGVLDNRDEEVA